MMWLRWLGVYVLSMGCALALIAGAVVAQPTTEIDLLGYPTFLGSLQRVHGSAGNGTFGVPVAGGVDCDGDGFADTAMASMLADPMGRSNAGEVYLVFGDGTIAGSYDTAVAQSRILRIAGVGTNENAGSEIWMDDVTGDGLGDLLIARQNFTSGGRIGAGALSIVIGSSELQTFAATLAAFDLGSPPAAVSMTTIVGANALDRLGIWVRTGDVSGDGVADIVVGADQQDNGLDLDAGTVYVIRGGSHLAANQTIDLADFGTLAFESSPLAGHVARIVPLEGTSEHHFGSTVQIADLDGNNRGEVLVATALNRAGAGLPAFGAPPGSAHGVGGSADGSVYIIWDDNFPAGDWTAAGLALDASALPGSRSLIHGGIKNVSFGEELLGGLDYDNDGAADLFVGDLTADLSVFMNRPTSGSGHVFYDAGTLKGETFDLDTPPAGLVQSTFVGAGFNDIAADTAAHGDFDDDGVSDLMFSSPHGDPFGRSNAGIVYAIYGQAGGWPSFVDMAALPTPATLRVTAVYGGVGDGGDAGDTLAYSAAAGDIDGDGKTDLITNEMLGNGTAVVDVGNLIVISGTRLSGQACPLDVDANGVVDGATDGVYIFRRLLGLQTIVPGPFRELDPSIASDALIGANIDALGAGLDVDGSLSVAAQTDGVYVFRRTIGLDNVVPQSFRDIDPSIPDDDAVAASIDALCP